MTDRDSRKKGLSGLFTFGGDRVRIPSGQPHIHTVRLRILSRHLLIFVFMYVNKNAIY